MKMTIETPSGLSKSIQDKHLLLDTSVFIDAIKNPKVLGEFFNFVRSCNATLVTIHPVLVEFVRGSKNDSTLDNKREFLQDIISVVLPITPDLFDKVMDLLEMYQIDGIKLSVTDLLLGATTIKYRPNILLVTKNTTDFPTNIFPRVAYFNLMRRKTIEGYSIQTFDST